MMAHGCGFLSSMAGNGTDNGCAEILDGKVVTLAEPTLLRRLAFFIDLKRVMVMGMMS